MKYKVGQKLQVIESCPCKTRGSLCYNKGDIIEVEKLFEIYLCDIKGRIFLKTNVISFPEKSLDDFI